MFYVTENNRDPSARNIPLPPLSLCSEWPLAGNNKTNPGSGPYCGYSSTYSQIPGLVYRKHFKSRGAACAHKHNYNQLSLLYLRSAFYLKILVTDGPLKSPAAYYHCYRIRDCFAVSFITAMMVPNFNLLHDIALPLHPLLLSCRCFMLSSVLYIRCRLRLGSV